MWELLPLALLSAVYPTLVAVVVVALASPRPAREMAFFLLGGMIASVSVGLAIVFAFKGTSLVTGSKPLADTTVYFGASAVAFLLAIFVWCRPPPQEDRKGRVTQLLRHGQRAAVAFGVGLLLNIAPGVWYIVALKDIAESSYHNAAILVIVVVFCIVQYALVEIPLLGFVFAPERAADTAERFSSWLGTNNRKVAVAVLIVAGSYMNVRGIISVA